MKNKIALVLSILVCWILLSHNTIAQSSNAAEIKNDTSSNYKCIVYVTVWPEYPGGRAAMNQFITDQLVYPETALKKKIEGRVVMGFTIESDGSLSDIRVLHTIDQSLNEEATRIVKLMPKWKPGRDHLGNVASTKYKLNIMFDLP